MEMRSRIENSAVILEFSESCLGSDNLRIRSEGEKLLAQEYKNFIFIFNESCYIDSSAFGTIIAIARKLLERKDAIVFIVKSKNVNRLFTVTRVNKIFKTANTVDDALAILTRKN